jgi:hypothetical protein
MLRAQALHTSPATAMHQCLTMLLVVLLQACNAARSGIAHDLAKRKALMHHDMHSA